MTTIFSESLLGPEDALPEVPARIHFIGIGGSSMSGLAMLAHSAGYTVSGSDRSASPVLQSLSDNGITVFSEQSAANITPGIDLVVYTVAVSRDNPELAAAISGGYRIIERGKFLGLISRKYKYTVSVSGTHGKTTTTAMLASIMLCAEYDPQIHIGGTMPSIGGSVRYSSGDYFVTEACEYHAHMLSLDTYGAIITNIEKEHMDFYGSMDNLMAAFSTFAHNCSPDGFVVVAKENANALIAASNSRARVITYAFADSYLNADYEAAEIVHTTDGSSYQLLYKGQPVARITLHIPGKHNVLNSLAAIAAAEALGVKLKAIQNGLEAFEGTGRRFQKISDDYGILLIDDYAHHPTEVEATLNAARDIIPEGGRVIGLFQVHTFTRAKLFPAEFAKALSAADEIVVADIYAAREQDPGDVSGITLAEYFRTQGLNARYISSFEDIAEYVSAIARRKDIVISLGAGDINQVLKIIMEKLKEKHSRPKV